MLAHHLRPWVTLQLSIPCMQVTVAKPPLHAGETSLKLGETCTVTFAIPPFHNAESLIPFVSTIFRFSPEVTEENMVTALNWHARYHSLCAGHAIAPRCSLAASADIFIQIENEVAAGRWLRRRVRVEAD